MLSVPLVILSGGEIRPDSDTNVTSSRRMLQLMTKRMLETLNRVIRLCNIWSNVKHQYKGSCKISEAYNNNLMAITDSALRVAGY